MLRKCLVMPFALAACAGLAAAPAFAGNGHFLHGIGAVNSSMGGAGVALPNDTLGALDLNPALLTQLDGYTFEFAAEDARAQNSVSSQVGPFSGTTRENGDNAIIPAFGWTHHQKDSKFAYGVGFLGMAGFGVDYPQDPSNPILAPQPQGFGRVYANYQMLRIPIVLAYQATPDLSLGLTLNAGRSSLTADPAGFAAPDCSSSTHGPVCFVPHVDTESAVGFGVQVGAYYKLSSTIALGLSYTSEQKFDSFEWNSAVANPNLPNYGADRHISLKLNNPQMVAGGIGLTPSDRLKIAIDGKWANYSDVEGFGTLLGWKDISTFAIGGQYLATERLTLRLGYNYTQNAIPDSASFLNVESPSLWGNHLTGGVGIQIEKNFQLNLAYYHAFPTKISGPFLGPQGPVAGTRVTNEMKMDSFLGAFSFKL